MKNIFYTSNANKDLFIGNTRSNFNTYIDINYLDYINDDDVEVGIKSIAFDNTQSIYIQPNVKQPHFIIVQEVSKKDLHPTFTYHLPKIVSLKSEKLIQELINVEEPKDFVIISSDKNDIFVVSQIYYLLVMILLVIKFIYITRNFLI